MEKTNGVLEQDVAKKKKRRKRKSSTNKANVAPVKTETKKVEVIKEVVKEEIVEDKEESKVTFNTFELEKIKSEEADRISYHRVPINAFSMKNLVLTICVVFLLIVFVVGGYYVGSLNYNKDLSTELDASHKVTGMVSEIEFAGHTLYVPFGFERVDSDTSVKIVDSIEGTSIELLGLFNEDVEFDETFVETNRLDLQDDGYVIYSSYILDNGMLVYTGLDSVFSTIKVVFAKNDNVMYKILVSNEYENISDDVYEFVEEFIGR